MVKAAVFILFVFGVMLYPVFLNGKHEPNAPVKGGVLPEVQFLDGMFYMYNPKLAKKGSFKDFEVYSKEHYRLKNIYLNDLEKQEEYKAGTSDIKGALINGKDVWYKNSDFTLTTDKAQYDKTSKILTGGSFEVVSKDFRGFGKSFKLDSEKNIYAQNIVYYLKADKWEK